MRMVRIAHLLQEENYSLGQIELSAVPNPGEGMRCHTYSPQPGVTVREVDSAREPCLLA